MESLQSLQRLERLERLQLDYQEVPIKRGDVIYCDPPYKGTSGYNGVGFNHNDFYRWAINSGRGNIVIISEYSMPEDFFEIARVEKRVLLGHKIGKAVEKLFIPKTCAKSYFGLMKGEQNGNIQSSLFDL